MQLKKQLLLEGDTISVCVFGFSRGAALARHFINHYINTKFKSDLPEKINFKVEAEFLFDTVPAFGIPLHIKMASLLGIQLENMGWDFSIPKGTKAYHALSIDERRWGFLPSLINYTEGMTEEIWFAGDHSSIGGGYKPSKPNSPMGDQVTLRYMAQSATPFLRFTEKFLNDYNINSDKISPYGQIETPSWGILPSAQRTHRHICVLQDNKKSGLAPIIDESVFRRLHEESLKQHRMSRRVWSMKSTGTRY